MHISCSVWHIICVQGTVTSSSSLPFRLPHREKKGQLHNAVRLLAVGTGEISIACLQASCCLRIDLYLKIAIHVNTYLKVKIIRTTIYEEPTMYQGILAHCLSSLQAC